MPYSNQIKMTGIRRTSAMNYVISEIKKQPKATLNTGQSLAVRYAYRWTSSDLLRLLRLVRCVCDTVLLFTRQSTDSKYSNKITPTARHIRYRQKRIKLCACNENATPNCVIHITRFNRIRKIFFFTNHSISLLNS